MTPIHDRRSFLRNAGAALAGTFLPTWAHAETEGVAHHGAIDPTTLSGDHIALTIGHSAFRLGRREGHAVTVNGSLPGPLIRLKEGQDVHLSVRNMLAEESSIHWHGLLVPFQYDGVPGISFPGIAAGSTFDYRFPIRQSGTYWYHSHSNMQEAMGLYGPIIIDPVGPDPIAHDREHVLILSDWSFLHPHMMLKKLKQSGGYFNRRKQTLSGLLAGRDQSMGDRLAWAKMRMDPTDIADVTGSAYTYLINGHDTAANWTGLFHPGERVCLRIINASAMTNFNVRLPGLPMTVVQADGQHVRPVETDELQIAIAETYDVIVMPRDAQPYAFVAEAIDRSGLCRATLAPQSGLAAPVPPLRARPLLTMKDMGMDMGGMDMEDMAGMTTQDHLKMMTDKGSGADMTMSMRDSRVAPGVKMGPGVATLSPMPVDRLADQPTGLEDAYRRVLTYAQLRSLAPNPDPRPPGRTIELHLTANMERYMWSFDGVKMSEGAEPISLRHMERVRLTLINDTMMPHPIHLHGHFFELVSGEPGDRPRKHTVNVLPGGKVSVDLTADALGDWAFHCHMLLHMHAGMFRVVSVRHEDMPA